MNPNRSTRPIPAPYAPVMLAVPPSYADELDRLTEVFAARTGEPPEDVRRGIETTVLRRGIEALKKEWDVR